MKYQIRSATLDDAVELQTMLSGCSPRGHRHLRARAPTLDEELDFIRTHTEADGFTMLVAVADGADYRASRLPGSAAATERHVGHFGISVRNTIGAAGVGSALIGELLEWAPVTWVTRVEVEAFAANPEAIRLYERLGFEREGYRRSCDRQRSTDRRDHAGAIARA